MGLLQSVFCSVTFCLERVLTWACCAFALILLMFSVVSLMIYGVSVGYHYAQKELASFALTSRSTEPPDYSRRSGGGEVLDPRPVVRFVAVNRSEVEAAPAPVLEVYKSTKRENNLYLETDKTPIFLLQTEKPPSTPELTARERELARRLIGRFRRSKDNNTLTTPFFRPLRNSTRF